MGLFLNTIADSMAGTVIFSLPSATTPGQCIDVEGYLTEDPTIKLQNNWEAIMPDLGMINDFAQIAGLGAKSWIATSSASWKGTDPIQVSLTFYLITCRLKQLTGGGKGPDMPITEQASAFAQLCAVSAGDAGGGSSDGFFSSLNVNVHGGYKPQVFSRNSEFSGKEKESITANLDTELTNMYGKMINNDTGTIQIVINGNGYPSMMFTKMLLNDITFNASTVRAGYWRNGVFIKSKEPLYIRCSANFRLAHAATVDDAARIFTGRGA